MSQHPIRIIVAEFDNIFVSTLPFVFSSVFVINRLQIIGAGF